MNTRTIRFTWQAFAIAGALYVVISTAAHGQDQNPYVAHPVAAPGEWDPYAFALEQRRLYGTLINDVSRMSDDHVLTFPLTAREEEILNEDVVCPTCEDFSPPVLGVQLDTDISADFSRVNINEVDYEGGTFEFGLLRHIRDGRLVWTTAVHSPNADALRLRFARVSLPETVELFIYTDQLEVHGPYTTNDINEFGDIWTELVDGEVAFVELRTRGLGTQADLDQTQFRLVGISHLRNHPFPQREEARAEKSSSCSEFINSNCDTEVDWPLVDIAESSIARLIYTDDDNGKITACTGGLINNVRNDQTPYLLTANHCIGSPTEAASALFVFRFQVPCNDSRVADSSNASGARNGYSGFPQVSGSKLLATTSLGTTDMTLLELDKAAPAGSWFMGWDVSTNYAAQTGLELFRVSHPWGWTSKYSTHLVTVQNQNAQKIQTYPKVGRADRGSSGSPVMLETGYIIGVASTKYAAGVCNGINEGNLYHAMPKFEKYLGYGPNTTTPPDNLGCSTGIIVGDDDDFTNGLGGFGVFAVLTLLGFVGLRFSSQHAMTLGLRAS